MFQIGVLVGVGVGVTVGVIVGVFVGVLVGVLVGVGPLNDVTTSPEELPLLFQKPNKFCPAAESTGAETDFGELAELISEALAHEVYGLTASVNFTDAESVSQETSLLVVTVNPAATESAVPVYTVVAELHEAGEPE